MKLIKKQINYQIKKHESTDSGQMKISGYATVFHNKPDLQGDIITKDAFLESINEFKNAKHSIPMLWNHKSNSPIGIWNEYKIDDKGLWVIGTLYTNDSEDAKFVAKGIKNGYITGLSIGFTIQHSNFIRDTSSKDTAATKNAKQIQVITKGKLVEISVVVMPAGGVHTTIVGYEVS